MTEKTKKGDFVELKFTGYANDEVFDSNIEEDYKKLDPEGRSKPQKTVVVVGEKMVVDGLDKALIDKEVGKEYDVSFSSSEGFGPRDRNLIRTIPLKAFTEQKVNPQAGMVLTLDNNLVKIIAVSGARVTADFNNPLAGKDLKYKFTIAKKVENEKEKAECLFLYFFRFMPKFEIMGEKVVVKLPKNLEPFVELNKERFKRLLGKELVFEELKEEVKDNNEKENKSDESERKSKENVKESSVEEK